MCKRTYINRNDDNVISSALRMLRVFCEHILDVFALVCPNDTFGYVLMDLEANLSHLHPFMVCSSCK